jgi:hypothetical protein
LIYRNQKMNNINRLKYYVCFYFLFFSFSTGFAETGRSSGGLGIILGNPTGISIKFLDNGATHFNAALSWSFDKDSYFHIHGDYIFSKYNLAHSGRRTNLQTFIGFGVQVETRHDNLALRLPLGIAYNFTDIPIDTFIELVPALELIPATDFHLGIALAIRYLF